MNICFVITKMVQQASGGYKMVFEYSNRLVRRGHSVSILFFNNDFLKKFGMPENIRKISANFLTHIGPIWFDLDKKVRLLSSEEKNLTYKLKYIDTVVYTAVESVYFGKDYFKNCQVKAYFIQGYEVGNLSKEQVTATYSMGYRNIVVAKWLKDIVDMYASRPSLVVRNPINTNIYKPVVPIRDRKNHTISVLYNGYEGKGFKYAYAVIKRLKQIYPDLEVFAFGTPGKADYFPKYFHYVRNASQKQSVKIYNKTAVFICTSIEEGYGLTGLEAMACGTTLVSTSYSGVFEYAKDGYNALLSPVCDVKGLVNNVCRLFDDDNLRLTIASNGIRYVKENFRWKEAVDRFESVLIGERE